MPVTLAGVLLAANIMLTSVLGASKLAKLKLQNRLSLAPELAIALASLQL